MPVNQFVKAFSKEEAAAVAKLKAELPAILKSAFKTDVQEPYKLWGIALDKDSRDERLDVILVKFLRARQLNLEAAKKMLTDSLAWRTEFQTDSILNEEFDESIFGSVGYMYKTDKSGRPVCYNFYGVLDQDKVFHDVKTFIRWRVQLMEKGVQLIDFETVDSMVQVHDYKGASMFGRTANSKLATKEIIKIMQDNYPEFLSLKYFVNIPWWGSKIFKLIRPLLPEATVKKFVVCSNDELVETLCQSIPEENLPSVYTSSSTKKDDKAHENIKTSDKSPAEGTCDDHDHEHDVQEESSSKKHAEKDSPSGNLGKEPEQQTVTDGTVTGKAE